MKQTARRNSWQYQQKSWTVFIRWYVLSLWHVAAAAAAKRETACTVWCGEMKTISKTQRRSAETDEAKAKKEMECDGLHLLWEYLTFKDLNSLVTRNADENSDRSKKENAATLESYTENMLSARNPNLCQCKSFPGLILLFSKLKQVQYKTLLIL